MKKALTMIELIIVIGLLGFALAGLLISYVSSLNLSEYDKNLTIAMNIAREKMERLYDERDEDFDGLGSGMCDDEAAGCSISGNNTNRVVSFNNSNIRETYNNFNGSCVIYIDEIDPFGDNLKQARVAVSWRQRLGRIIGEDKNLNGLFDGGDDNEDGDGLLNSPCEITTAFANR